MRVVLLLLPLVLAPAVARAQAEFPASCPSELAEVDASFVETQEHLEKGFKGDKAAKCEAVAHHIDVMKHGIDVFMRCMSGHDQGENVGQLGDSIEDFEYIAQNLGCP